MADNRIRNYYTILGLQGGAGIREVKKAYRTKAKEYHPDVNNAPNAHLQFIYVNEAYEFIINRLQSGASINDENSNGSTRSNTTRTPQADYDTWVQQERAKSRARAAKHAKMKFEEFQKTKIYKTSRFFYQITNYLFFLLGIAIITVPIIYTASHGLRPKNEARDIVAVIAAVTIGLAFISAIFFSNFSLDKGRIKRKPETFV